MRYRVATSGVRRPAIADVETWFDDPAEAADLFMELLAQDDTTPHNSGHRLLTCLLLGDRSFAVLSGNSYYKIEALP